MEAARQEPEEPAQICRRQKVLMSKTYAYLTGLCIIVDGLCSMFTGEEPPTILVVLTLACFFYGVQKD